MNALKKRTEPAKLIQESISATTGELTRKGTSRGRAILLWVGLGLLGVFAFGASATNVVIQSGVGAKSAADRASDKFERQLHAQDVPTVTESAKQLAATDEPMPEKAKPTKTREDAKEVLRPLVSKISTITYDPFGASF